MVSLIDTINIFFVLIKFLRVHLMLFEMTVIGLKREKKLLTVSK